MSMFPDLEPPYDVVLLDPPWEYYGAKDKWGAAGKEYDCMGWGEIVGLNVDQLCAPRSVVFIWTTSAMLGSAIALFPMWGMHYRGVAFVWVKTKKDGITPLGAQGVRPSITKPLTELVVVGSFVEKGRPLPLADESICQTVFAPRREHSRKPDEVQDRIEKMYPAARKCELFARSRRDNWDSFGNQLDKFTSTCI